MKALSDVLSVLLHKESPNACDLLQTPGASCPVAVGELHPLALQYEGAHAILSASQSESLNNIAVDASVTHSPPCCEVYDRSYRHFGV